MVERQDDYGRLKNKMVITKYDSYTISGIHDLRRLQESQYGRASLPMIADLYEAIEDAHTPRVNTHSGRSRSQSPLVAPRILRRSTSLIDLRRVERKAPSLFSNLFPSPEDSDSLLDNSESEISVYYSAVDGIPSDKFEITEDDVTVHLLTERKERYDLIMTKDDSYHLKLIDQKGNRIVISVKGSSLIKAIAKFYEHDFHRRVQLKMLRSATTHLIEIEGRGTRTLI